MLYLCCLEGSHTQLRGPGLLSIIIYISGTYQKKKILSYLVIYSLAIFSHSLRATPLPSIHTFSACYTLQVFFLIFYVSVLKPLLKKKSFFCHTIGAIAN